MFLLPSLLALAAGVSPQRAPSTHYRVEVDTTLRVATVTVTLPRTTSRLLMDSVQAQQLTRGWATFVRDLTARAGETKLVVSPDDGAATWRVAAGPPGAMTISYAIDLGFTRTPWPVGNEQAGATLSDALYIVGRALFIVADASDSAGEIAVDFALPAGWRVSTPWRSSGATGRSFIVANATELTRNPLVIGRHQSVRIDAGPFALELALPGQPRTAAPLAEPALRRVLDAYIRLFPETPRAKYLMTFFRSSADDGEAFLNGASFTTTDSVTADGLIIWGNFLAHELMHFWNGQRIHGAPPRTGWRWLAEGFTEYYANVTLAREGVISQELFLKKAERHLGNYLYFATAPALPRMSLFDAGTNTGANRFGVYDGGWTVALCLDGLIREGSGDRRSLDDFMRELWRRFGPDRPGYTVASLDTLVGELSGTNSAAIVARYVESRDVLPVSECVARFGFSVATKGYAAEAFISPSPTATPARRARGRALSGLRPR